MDKWLQNDLVLRIISVGIAIIMWLTVTDASISYSLIDKYKTTIRDVSIEAKYDHNRFELVKMTNKCELTLYGDKFTLDHIPSTYRIFVDLSKLGAGKHLVPVQVEGLPFGIERKVNPAKITVVLEEKLQKEMPVQVDLIGKLAEGYKAGEPIVNPVKVLIGGSESKLEQVKAVKAFLYMNNVTETINKTVKLQLYGERGPINDMDINPEVVNVVVPINSPNKEVPLGIMVKKGPPPGFAIESIKSNIDKVTVYGPQSYIDSLQFYEGPNLDLSNVTKDITIRAAIPMRDGINKVEPKEVEVYVKMVPAKTKLIQKVPLQVIGVGNRLKANIITPAGGSIDITLSGAPSLLGKIDVSNIKAYLDVSNLPAGNHEVPIRFNLPFYIQVKGQNELKATVQLSS